MKFSPLSSHRTPSRTPPARSSLVMYPKRVTLYSFIPASRQRDTIHSLKGMKSVCFVEKRGCGRECKYLTRCLVVSRLGKQSGCGLGSMGDFGGEGGKGAAEARASLRGNKCWDACGGGSRTKGGDDCLVPLFTELVVLSLVLSKCESLILRDTIPEFALMSFCSLSQS